MPQQTSQPGNGKGGGSFLLGMLLGVALTTLICGFTFLGRCPLYNARYFAKSGIGIYHQISPDTIIDEFDDVTTDQFTEALAVIKGSGAKGLVLDLRGNPGGSLNVVVDIARQILPKGLIVYVKLADHIRLNADPVDIIALWRIICADCKL